MRRALAAAAAALIAALVAAPIATAGSPAPWTYAVIGDTPYGQPQIDNFANDVAQINADRKVKVVIHLGDIKNGSSLCDTSYFEQIRALFATFRDPFVYTPGDNEWTDCHRANNGGYNPGERLDTIRQLFFDQPGQALGKHEKSLDSQAAPYVENVRWAREDVQFATVDVPGSNNDWAPWFGVLPRTQQQIDEFTGRNAADLAWIDRVFAIAKKRHSKAVVIGIQADMWDPAFSGANDDPTAYDHFTDVVRKLADLSLAFGKPVLLLNGDSHAFVDDHPLADAARPFQKTMYGVTQDVPNLRRITVNGSTTPCHEYLRLTVDQNAANPFSVQRVLFHNQPGFDPAVCPAS